MAIGTQAEYFDDILQCRDCGTALVSDPDAFVQAPSVSAYVKTADSETAEDAREPSARLAIGTGAFVLLAGLGVAIATYALAWSGGVYIVARGPMIYGFIRLHEGLSAHRCLTRRQVRRGHDFDCGRGARKEASWVLGRKTARCDAPWLTQCFRQFRGNLDLRKAFLREQIVVA